MTTARNQHIDDLIDLYTLGALEPSEQEIADEHLRGCAHCRALLNESERIVAALARTPEQIEPPADLRARVMARAQQARPAVSVPSPAQAATPPASKAWWRQLGGPPQGRTPLLVRRVIGVGALALLLALAGNTVRLQGQIRQTQKEAATQQQTSAALQSQMAQTQSEAATRQQTIVALRSQMEQTQKEAAAQQQTSAALQSQMEQTQKEAAAQRQIIDAVRAPGTRVVAFSGTGANVRSQLVVNAAGNQAFLLADGLPVLPPDKTYELWLLQGQKPVGSNLFHVDQHGSATLQVQVPTQLKDYQAAAISVEPAGGSTAPTTTPFLLTKF
ncbi:MAG: anti-sigma factor [Herpetosiphonaceae bacterium]|nr:anti-sigma factor [Herpetosiphonaceae bacterium]